MSKPENTLSQVCSDTTRLQRYLNEELSEHEEAQVQEHINSCADCQASLEKVAASQSVWDGLRDNLTWVPSGDTEEDVENELRVPPALGERVAAT